MLHQTLADIFDPTSVLGAVTYGVIFVFLALFAGRGVRALAHHSENHLSDLTALRFVTQLLRVLIYLLAFIIYARMVPALHELGTTLLTGVSVVGVVIGIAAQSTLSNLVAGFSLVMYRPFHVGDEVQLTTPKGLTTGTVTNLSLGYTMLHDKDDEEIIVPNSVMSTNVVILSRARGAKVTAGSRIIQSVERDQAGKGSGGARAD
ncbi:MAG TPA: mechanosensitive ion channel domain-containing protein [Gammaproteobacteria bacterium]|jgi:small-conductance mechanosensitive channel|nr:mechanosensitive ion channel domain-containing protein [Gammaproteobacteria bacterium]